MSLTRCYKLPKDFIVFVPYCKLYEPYIEECLLSLQHQNYPVCNVLLLVVNDGVTDIKNIKRLVTGLQCRSLIISAKQNGGPAYSKYIMTQAVHYLTSNSETNSGITLEKIRDNFNDFWFKQHVHVSGNISQSKFDVFASGFNNKKLLVHGNSIVIILDGDDSFLVDTAIQTISNAYTHSKCKMTYGSCIGQWSEQCAKSLATTSNVRQSTWVFGHPRTFLARFCQHFCPTDFQDASGKWLQKSTDAALIYNVIEWVGMDAVVYLPHLLYNYRTHQFNSFKTITPVESTSQKKHVRNARPKQKLNENRIDIVMCCYKRHFLLSKQLDSLESQTVAQNIHFNILNNNSDANGQNEVENIVQSWRQKRSNRSKITVNLFHYDNSNFAFERFLFVRDVLYGKTQSGFVVFVDDDQTFDCGWVEQLWKSRQPESIVGWFCKLWPHKNSCCYWKDATCLYLDEHKTHSRQVDYVGTGGCVVDCSIFHPQSKLWEIPNKDECGVEIKQIEDLWLCFVASHYYKWNRIQFLQAPIQNNSDRVQNVALYKTLKNCKSKFLRYLLEQKKWSLMCSYEPLRHRLSLPLSMLFNRLRTCNDANNLIAQGSIPKSIVNLKLPTTTTMPKLSFSPYFRKRRKEIYKFVFIVPAFNVKNWYVKNLASIFSQNVDRSRFTYRVLYIDDCSTDGTPELVQKWCLDNSQLDRQISYKVVTSLRRRYQAYTRFVGYQLCNSDEIALLLDGDDWLAHSNVLLHVTDFFDANPTCDMAYNSYCVLDGPHSSITDPKDADDYSEQVKLSKSFRTVGWKATHFRMMRVSLLHKISASDLMMNGEWLQCSTDWAESFVCLENATNPLKLKLPKKAYVYNKVNSKLHSNSFYNIHKEPEQLKYRAKVQKMLKNLPATCDRNLKSTVLFEEADAKTNSEVCVRYSGHKIVIFGKEHRGHLLHLNME